MKIKGRKIVMSATERSVALVGAMGAGIRAAGTHGCGAHGPKGSRPIRRANRAEERNARRGVWE